MANVLQPVIPAVPVPPAKVARLQTNYSLCIVCQKQTDDSVVTNPVSYEQLLIFVRQRGTYGDGSYPEISRRLEDCTSDKLVASGAFWHRKCYQETVHKGMLQRAKKKYELQIAAKSFRRGS